MVAANELRCTAFPRIFDITDETRMRMVGEFRLESNDRCLDDPQWAEANRAGGYGLHYNSVADAAYGYVALGMFNFMGSGLRVVDLRDPTHPREIAYYHPGDIQRTSPTGTETSWVRDSCVSKNVFVHESQQIWFGCRSGLYVAELSDGVKSYLGVVDAATAE